MHKNEMPKHTFIIYLFFPVINMFSLSVIWICNVMLQVKKINKI